MFPALMKTVKQLVTTLDKINSLDRYQNGKKKKEYLTWDKLILNDAANVISFF